MSTKHNILVLLALVSIFIFIACSLTAPDAPDDTLILDGPVEGLSSEETRQFLAGDVAFNDDVFTPENGLGPLFVATTCGSCHIGDGKGHPFTTLTRFGQSDSTGNVYLDRGGPQLQHRAIPGFTPESVPQGAPSAKFLPPISTGLGFLEAVPESDLLTLADPQDLDSDGISGVPNWRAIPSYVFPLEGSIPQNGKYLCRFGRKAGVHNLLQQTSVAYNQDIGVTSIFEPLDTYSGLEIDPEISTQTVLDVVFYLRTLKVPPRRDSAHPDVLAGATIFQQIGCASCHTPHHKTGSSSIAALGFKDIYPYSDLLLHDMGPALDDGYTEGSAASYEWRTPPLWGLGLSPKSQGGEYFLLHDGRAKTVDEAIRLHGGEASGSQRKYILLSEGERLRLIKFLESL
jgi:CxxC motif-containing protein (DUF1111 family)